jgi:uncharacterized membrane protein
VKRFPYIDWLRGLAVLLMILCHTFNSFARENVRDSGVYLLSQFAGGMAAPLFLFMAGMTLGFLVEKPGVRWTQALRRGVYVLGIAYLFRLFNFLGGLPRPDWSEFSKVEILNCMGAAMVVFSAAARCSARWRVRAAVLGAVAVAAAAPPVAAMDWGWAPPLLRNYLVPLPGAGRFPFFPYASYVGLGLASGAVLRRTAAPSIDRLMQWVMLAGFALVLSGQYFSRFPYSLYRDADFWSNSPALVSIRFGICFLLMGAAYVWTEYAVGAGRSWVQCLGRHSLLVYWVHIALVYGDLTRQVQRGLGISRTALATLAVIAAMVALAAVWERCKRRWILSTDPTTSSLSSSQAFSPSTGPE